MNKLKKENASNLDMIYLIVNLTILLFELIFTTEL